MSAKARLMSEGWANDPIKAAGGRRRINAERQAKARARQANVRRFLLESGTSLVTRGVQRALAARFGVSEATMSRDVRAIWQTPAKSHRCPWCGAKALDAAGLEAIAAGTDRFGT